ncbi:protein STRICTOSIDINE SYNTHASE-LIKE 6-like [Iris pallida]|uniref:Protein STRICTOSIDINE SYNTHASE-LIKE 6-like n=1 Tax=Iris pallida TaxID=29817 RepID=A0AAX6GLR4_IRIPA|nr:protein STRICTOSIDINE SYNTHASE-LIKE 6-like [Iris pallida]
MATAATMPAPLFVLLLSCLVAPVAISILLYSLAPEGFDAAPIHGYSFEKSIAVAEKKERVLRFSERVGDGRLTGCEDFAYDAESGYLYTGCDDGWIRRVRLLNADEPEVEDWVHVGGRPAGMAFGLDKCLLVADVHKGLLMVKEDKSIHLLTDEAEGLKFGLTDGVDVASDGVIYFTDASYKYTVDTYMTGFLEGRPYGRLMSFDPYTNQTTVLVRDLYFANGVSLSPDQHSVIFCDTVLRSCKRYHIDGDKKGTVEKFIDNLPGLPDNIRYDGDGHYWIGLSDGRNFAFDMIVKYPLLRKMLVVIRKYVRMPESLGHAGVMSVTLDGNPVSLYSDPELDLVTTGLKIGKHLYYTSLVSSYISRIDLTPSLPKDL